LGQVSLSTLSPKSFWLRQPKFCSELFLTFDTLDLMKFFEYLLKFGLSFFVFFSRLLVYLLIQPILVIDEVFKANHFAFAKLLIFPLLLFRNPSFRLEFFLLLHVIFFSPLLIAKWPF